MEDKAFNLLEKMYIEFTKFREETNERFDKVDAVINGLKGDVMRIENNHGAKLNALFDGYSQTYEKLETVEEKVDDLSSKVDRHDIKIQVIEGGRK